MVGVAAAHAQRQQVMRRDAVRRARMRPPMPPIRNMGG
ncbi:hypothetical protein IM53_003445 [Xanthomonas phaseoli pv. dieffenbachiae]|uniref:Uncharacterized protein n=1 Tax=Xanthomonas phaseoli pv. dieffenbachiae TaxID=92828 RepID=A0A1V9HGN8_9XANT|nr:hypothetical protein IM53_003445 [Xanthomonas phaseoli pv. dieffenbachiae]